jgi:hypothetical protein
MIRSQKVKIRSINFQLKEEVQLPFFLKGCKAESSLLVSECRASGVNGNAAACLCFLNNLAFSLPAADRTEFCSSMGCKGFFDCSTNVTWGTTSSLHKCVIGD